MSPFTFFLKEIQLTENQSILHCDLLAMQHVEFQVSCLSSGTVWRKDTLKVHPEDVNNSGTSHSSLFNN